MATHSEAFVESEFEVLGRERCNPKYATRSAQLRASICKEFNAASLLLVPDAGKYGMDEPNRSTLLPVSSSICNYDHKHLRSRK